MGFSEWHIWVIKLNKFAKVEKHLNELEEVEEFLYPTVTKEFKSMSGKIIKKRVPMYSGYLFIKYFDVPETFHKINEFPFITTYVGKCSGEDLKRVRDVKEIELLNTNNKSVGINDLVSINSGPFKGFEGAVISTASNNITVMLSVFGRSTPVSLSQDDADIVKRVG